MSVTFELIDGPYPHLCALYRCRCGAVATCHGDEAGQPPVGWRERPDADESHQHVCPRCAEAMRTGTAA